MVVFARRFCQWRVGGAWWNGNGGTMSVGWGSRPGYEVGCGWAAKKI